MAGTERTNPGTNEHTLDSNLPISVLLDQIKQTKPKPNLPR